MVFYQELKKVIKETSREEDRCEEEEDEDEEKGKKKFSSALFRGQNMQFSVSQYFLFLCEVVEVYNTM